MRNAIVDATGFRSGFAVVDIEGSGICDGGAWMPLGEEASGVVVVVVVVFEQKSASCVGLSSKENHAANPQHYHRHDDASPFALPLLQQLLPRAGPSPHSNETRCSWVQMWMGNTTSRG